MLLEAPWSAPVLLGLLVGLLAMTAVSTRAEGDGAPPFSHQALTRVLERFVDDQGKVDYPGLAADRKDLDAYVASLAAVSPASHPTLFPTRQDALAYYLNSYNAQVLVAVLRLDPKTESVWPTMWAGYQFFVRNKFTLGGSKFHLKGLEDDVVRAQFEDPRVHAVLNCASIGCPRLPQKAMKPETLEDELDAAMQEFVRSPQHVRLDLEGRTVQLSKIFDWFEKDFLHYERQQGVARPNLIGYVNRYRTPEGQIPTDFAIRFLPYDKSLNRQ